MLKLIRSMFASAPVPTVPQAQLEVEKEPTFLLDETAGEYRRLVIEGEMAIAAVVASITTQSEQKRVEADLLRKQVVQVVRSGERNRSPASVELSNRKIGRLEKDADRLRDEAAELRRAADIALSFGSVGFDPRDHHGFHTHTVAKFTPSKWAKWEARLWEMRKVFEKGKLVHSSVVEGKGVDPSFSGAWDKIERRIIKYSGRFFLLQIRERAVTTHGEWRETGGHMQIGPSYSETTYSPTGEYEAPSVDWVTNSVAQMTKDELEAVVSNS